MKSVAVLISLLLICACSPFVNAVSSASIDLYTRRGGKGAGEASGPFKVGELVVLFAEVKENDVPLEGKTVGFYTHGPVNAYQNMTVIQSEQTNASGIASVSFRIGSLGMDHWEEILLGTWSVVARVEISNEVYDDSMTFECGRDLTVDLFTQKGGLGFEAESPPFRAGEVVILYMLVTNRTVPVPNILVEFEEFIETDVPNVYVAYTNESGIAMIDFRLPWKLDRTYQVLCQAKMRTEEYVMGDYFDSYYLAGERIRGDINYDGKVDIKDIAACAISFGSSPGLPRWNPECDLNNDDRIDIKDIATTAKNFGKTLP